MIHHQRLTIIRPRPRITVPAGLMAYWSMDRSAITGTTLADESGFGYNGTLVTSPGIVPGVINDALLFNGINQRVDLPAAAFPGGVNASFTITGWFNEVSVSGFQNIFSFKGSSEYYTFGTRGSTMGPWKAGGAFWVSFPAPVANSWHMFASGYDGTNHILWLDGLRVAVATSALNTSGITSARIACLAELNIEFYNGPGEEFRIYNRILYDSEIYQINSSGLKGTP